MRKRKEGVFLKTVLIMGAGAVRAASGTKAIAKRPPLDRDFFEIAKKSHRSQCALVEKHVRDFVGKYSLEVLRSLEETTTLLYLKAVDSRQGDRAHKAFLAQLTLLRLVLSKTTNELPTGPATLLYRLFRAELDLLEKAEDLTIITFNYDLMIERTLQSLQEKHPSIPLFSFPGCYRLSPEVRTTGVGGNTARFIGIEKAHRGVGVLKLHGSMNWISTHKSATPLPSALFGVKRELTVLDSTLLHPELTWKPGKKKLYVQPIILPPVTGKRGLLHKGVGRLWQTAANALRDADRVIVFGYSCPPMDFEAKILLGEHIQPERTSDLIVIDPCTSVAAKFVSLSGVEKARVYSCAKALLREH